MSSLDRNEKINVFQPSLGERELSAVRSVFESNWVGRGRVAAQFEEAFADYLGVAPESMLSVTSCTAGLFLAMRILDLPYNSVVIMPSIHFSGAANAVLAAGCLPGLCDVDPRSLNPTAEHIQEAYNRYGARCKAILLLHYGGEPCDMDGIMAFAREKGLFVVEDSACSMASRYKGKACGAIGDIGLWSFDAMKVISTGDGGMMYLSTPSLRLRAQRYGYLGQVQTSGLATASAADDTEPPKEWWSFDVSHAGSRVLMNDVTAAIGLAQLARLPSFLKQREYVSSLYTSKLARSGLLLPQMYTTPYYFYWVQFRDRYTRNRVAQYLLGHGVYTTYRYWPLHKVTLYRNATGVQEEWFPGANLAEATTLLLPLHARLKDTDVDRVCNLLLAYL